MKRSFGVVHCQAKCDDCGWEAENYKNAQGIAAIHARKYGHKVRVDIELAGYYDGR